VRLDHDQIGVLWRAAQHFGSARGPRARRREFGLAGKVKLAQTELLYDPSGECRFRAREALAVARAIIGTLVEQHPDQRQWKQDLARFDAQIAELEKTSPKKKPA
jgi:hypothetical protein